MADEQEVSMVDLTDELQSGVLTNPNDNALFNADYFKQNGPQVFTIRGFVKRQFMDEKKGPQNAWVVKFQEDVPGLKLNMTNQTKLVEIMQSNRFDDMIGRRITLYFDPNVTMGSKKTGGVRIERAEDLAS